MPQRVYQAEIFREGVEQPFKRWIAADSAEEAQALLIKRHPDSIIGRPVLDEHYAAQQRAQDDDVQDWLFARARAYAQHGGQVPPRPPRSPEQKARDMGTLAFVLLIMLILVVIGARH